MLNKYRDILDEIEYKDSMSCSELLTILKEGNNSGENTLLYVYTEMIEACVIKESTKKQYGVTWNVISKILNPSLNVGNLNSSHIYLLERKLFKKNYRPTSVKTTMVFLKSITSFAEKKGIVSFKINPWLNYEMPQSTVRENWITKEDFYRIKNLDLKRVGSRMWRDIFLLSFYFGGMNLIDLANLDLDKVLATSKVSYKRHKVTGLKRDSKKIEFQIPDEAKEIIKSLKLNEVFLNTKDLYKRQPSLEAFMRRLRLKLGIDNLTFYSARKLFSQIAFEIGVHSYVIDYLLGHSVRNSATCLYHYVYVTSQMATDAIRKVLDYVKL